MSLSNELHNRDLHFIHLIDHIDLAVWELDINTNTVKWSDGFYKALGYAPGEIECSSKCFFEYLLHPEDRELFMNTAFEPGSDVINARMLSKNSGYQWFGTTCKRYKTDQSNLLYGIVININPYKLLEEKSARRDLLLTEAGSISKTAVWELDASSMYLSILKESYDIFETDNPENYGVDKIISFFEPPHQSLAANAIKDVINSGKGFDLELLARTAKNKVLWVRFKAMPVIDEHGKCTRVTGILQDIDQDKKRELAIQDKLNLSNDQNKRMQNFAYIVSHNLRSYTGNLKFMVNLFKQADASADREEIFEHIRSICESLNDTIEHLGEVVKIEAEIVKETKRIEFEPLFKNITYALRHNIDESGAKIEFDFSKCPEINYIPAYMESILQNLLTNALKYRRKGHQPLIKCHTYIKNKHCYLIFEDNGIGIDLEKHGDSVFGMYKTFHENPDAKGIGLFITRNQVESLGGAIMLESTVNVGTKFTIRLN